MLVLVSFCREIVTGLCPGVNRPIADAPPNCGSRCRVDRRFAPDADRTAGSALGRHVGAPTAVDGDWLGRADGLALAQKALWAAVVGEQQCADAEWRRNAGDEARVGLGWQRPHLGGDGMTCARSHA